MPPLIRLRLSPSLRLYGYPRFQSDHFDVKAAWLSRLAYPAKQANYSFLSPRGVGLSTNQDATQRIGLDSNQRPGVQPLALPLSYRPYPLWRLLNRTTDQRKLLANLDRVGRIDDQSLGQLHGVCLAGSIADS